MEASTTLSHLLLLRGEPQKWSYSVVTSVPTHPAGNSMHDGAGPNIYEHLLRHLPPSLPSCHHNEGHPTYTVRPSQSLRMCSTREGSRIAGA